jgi:hypothetical protein
MAVEVVTPGEFPRASAVPAILRRFGV